MNILDDYQRMGLGHKLINKLMRHKRNQGYQGCI